MSEHAGEKTEAPTPRKLEEAQKKGQFARSAEVQTVGVMLGGLLGLMFSGKEIWHYLEQSMIARLDHLHDTPVTEQVMQNLAGASVLGLAQCLWPAVAGTVLGGLLAGAVQSRFMTSPEAIGFHPERLNPVAGLQRLISMRSAVPTILAIVKLLFIGMLTWSTVRQVLSDPIFTQAVGIERLLSFLTESSLRISVRVLLLLGVVAAADYGYQSWRTYHDLMMTKDEVKEEAKNSEGNPQLKGARRRFLRQSKRRMLEAVATADVVITNPTRIAVALKYDRKKMRAPQIVAKGVRLNAKQIREIAQFHRVPMVENKPLARLMYKHGRIGGEIPAQLYAAVAEVLAWVYRTNRYRYYAEQNRA